MFVSGCFYSIFEAVHVQKFYGFNSDTESREVNNLDYKKWNKWKRGLVQTVTHVRPEQDLDNFSPAQRLVHTQRRHRKDIRTGTASVQLTQVMQAKRVQICDYFCFYICFYLNSH